MNYDAFIYDLDGTILNTFDMNIYPLMSIVKEELGLEMTYEELSAYSSTPGPKTLESLGIKDIPKVYERWVTYVNAYQGGASIYFNFDEIIQTLDSKIVQAVVSSKKRAQYKIDMRDKKLHPLFEAVVLLEDTKNHKPHPDPLLLCAKKLGLEPERCLYIGDSLSDFESANAAGMDFAFALWGSFKAHEIKNPKYVLRHPKDLLRIVSSIDKSPLEN